MKTPYYKTIKIPHLYTDVHFADLSKLKGMKIEGFAYTMQVEDGSVAVFVKDLEKSIKNPVAFPVLAHEVTHVLQFLCEKCLMDFTNEKEHMAYLMVYILNELLGYEGYEVPTN